MKSSSQKLLAFILILALTTLACSTFSSGNGNNPNVADNIGFDSDSNDANNSGGGGGSLFSSNPDTLNLDDLSLYAEVENTNYNIYMDFNISATGADGSSTFYQIILNGQRNLDPPASYMLMEPNDPTVMEGYQFFELVDVDGIDYMNIGGLGCSVFANEEFDNPYNTMADTGGFLIGEAERIGTDTVNGIKVDVYEITKDNLDPADETTRDIQEITEGKVYVAYDGYLVGIYLAGSGSSQLLAGSNATIGDMVYDIYFTPTDEQFDIQPPEDCSMADDLGFPVLDDAKISSSMGGLYSYTTDYDFATIVEFYKTEMAALGHTLAEEMVYDPTASLSFTRAEGGTTSVIVSQNPTGEGYQVLVLEE